MRTSRLGVWTPASVEERLDRIEALAEIQQLAVRYALAVDARDLDTLVSLFVPDVRVGRGEHGRPALRAWFAQILTGMRVSVHFVGNHVVDFDDPDHARGVVYCRDELERPESRLWEVGMLQYWDDYVRADGEWCFERRRFHRWYLTDTLTRPGHRVGVNTGSDPLPAALLPDAFPTWAAFWDAASSSPATRGAPARGSESS